MRQPGAVISLLSLAVLLWGCGEVAKTTTTTTTTTAAATGTWAGQSSMPTARAGLAVGVLGSTLYAVGGEGPSGVIRDSLESYNPATNLWSIAPAIAAAAAPRRHLAAGVLYGRLYVAGGYEHLAGTASGASRALESYNPATNAWLAAADMPAITGASFTPGRAYLAAGVLNSIFYVAAGLSTPGALVSLTSYNPLTNTWRDAAPLPMARESVAAAVLNSVLYVVGGWTGNTALASLTSYNPLLNSWFDAAPMPTARYGLAAVALRSILYAVGGLNAAGSPLAVVESYNPLTNAWTTLASLSTARGYLAAGELNSVLYAVGGWNGTTVLASVEAFTPP